MTQRLVSSAILVAASLATGLAAQLSNAVAAGAAIKLHATVGPGAVITLKNSAGRTVKTLRPGSYRIVVRDRSRRHNFHLVGPTNDLNRSTGVRFVGTQTWRMTLTKGTYRFVCDAHARTMKGTFRVS